MEKKWGSEMRDLKKDIHSLLLERGIPLHVVCAALSSYLIQITLQNDYYTKDEFMGRLNYTWDITEYFLKKDQ